MAWYSRFLPAHGDQVDLAAAHQRAVAVWAGLPAADLRRSHYRTRYVVVDVETAVRGDRGDALISLGAVAVSNGLIDFHDALEVHLADNTEHGGEMSLSEQAQKRLLPAREALVTFLQFAGKAPLLAFHASFVARIVDSAVAEYLGIDLRQPWIDLAWVMSDLFRDGAADTTERLDKWLDQFDVECILRHHVVSDAYAAARLLQITMARAARMGFMSPSSLLDLERARRHLHQSG